VIVCLQPKEVLEERLAKRHELAKFIVDFLYLKSNLNISKADKEKEEILVEFSVHELKAAYENGINLRLNIGIDDIEDTLFYLSRIGAIKLEGGFMVIYNRLTIERTEQDNKKRYTKDDYQKLHQYYENKVQQIHIVGEYASRMIADYKDALQFVEDYFQLNYTSFLNKYFKGSRQNEIKLNLTPAKFKQLFGELSPTQLKIINDNETKYIVVAAGPGSGKTKVLVHKLASLLLMEDVKHEQLLMLTFSRAAATEFKKRLLKLIGPLANYIEIKTFHSYCFDLLGKVGSLEKSEVILKKTIEKIKNGDVEANRITKTVLVIDEAQDMDGDEFNLVKALMVQNEEMRVIAVGDDDQNIYAFRGASSKYLEQFSRIETAVKHELIENYRSKSNLVDFANQFVQQIPNRLKVHPIVGMQPDNGKIKLIRYQSGNLVEPLVNDLLSSGLSGTTCILTKTNEEALQLTGLLLKNKMQAKLIQTNEGFNLHCLLEIRFFLAAVKVENEVSVISDDLWDEAKRALVKNFKTSDKLAICKTIIKDFEATNPKKKYKSDLDTFIRESKLEDFFSENGETIFVSTIHKAKGREFDNVFLPLENFGPLTDEAKRQLYVAITRAKKNLTIHVNANFLDHVYNGEMERVQDDAIYQSPNELIMQLTHENVYLDHFARVQPWLENLRSGDPLKIKAEGCADANGKLVLKFSRKFQELIAQKKANGYVLKKASINYIVYWQPEGKEQELKVILPEVCFERAILTA
jgi:ATP-dependent DNA helicase RecQ